jgi:uncharacterized Rmd1/YagE family protein
MRFRYYFSNGEHVLVGDDGRDTSVSILDCRLENYGFVVMWGSEYAGVWNTLDEAKRIAVEAYRDPEAFSRWLYCA